MRNLLTKLSMAVLALLVVSCSSWTVKVNPTVDVMVTSTGVHNRDCTVEVVEGYGTYIDANVTARVELNNNTAYNAKADVVCSYRDKHNMSDVKTETVRGVFVPKFTTLLFHVKKAMNLRNIHSAWTHCTVKWSLQK